MKNRGLLPKKRWLLFLILLLAMHGYSHAQSKSITGALGDMLNACHYCQGCGRIA